MRRKIINRYYWTIKQFFVAYAPGFTLKLYYHFAKRKGRKIFESLLRSCSDETLMVICPYAGTGDIYLAAAYIKEYLRRSGYKDCVFAVIGNSNVKVAKLFQIEKICRLSQFEMDEFMKFLAFYGFNQKNILIAHPDAPNSYLGIMDAMRNYNQLNFADMYARGVFCMEPEAVSKPAFAAKSRNAEQLIKSKKIKKGKAVLLSPYSYTLPGLPDWVWRLLAEQLKEKGYCVCTNCGSPHEPEIDGTIRVCLAYSEIACFLEYAGNFIGIRSGFCDIISSVPCRKIIIYQPYMFWGPAGNMDYFSLKEMGLDKNAVEIEYEGIDFYKLLEDITQNL